MIENVSYNRGKIEGTLGNVPLNTLFEIPSKAKGRRRFFLLFKSVYETKLDVDEALPPSNTNFQHCYVRQHGLVVGSYLDVVANYCVYNGLSVAYMLPADRDTSDFVSPTEASSGGVLLFYAPEGSFMVIPATPTPSPLLVSDKGSIQ